MEKEEREEENRLRSGRRAASVVRKRVRYGNLTRLLTFTNGGEGEGWRTRREAVRSFWTWYREVGHKLLGRTGIVVVPERGRRGRRWHVHAAIRRGYRLNYRRIIRSWSAYLESTGYHSATGTHRFHAGDEFGRHPDGFASARTCAGYMAEYLSEGFEDDGLVLGEHRYESEGCAIPEPQRFGGFRLADVPALVLDTFGTGCHQFYDGEGLLSGYFFESGG